jgi:nucleoside-diphosphate-sugar epimerase
LLTPFSRAQKNPLLHSTESLHALRFHPVVNGEKAARELGHHSRPLVDTIRDTYAWFTAPRAHQGGPP